MREISLIAKTDFYQDKIFNFLKQDNLKINLGCGATIDVNGGYLMS